MPFPVMLHLHSAESFLFSGLCTSETFISVTLIGSVSNRMDGVLIQFANLNVQ